MSRRIGFIGLGVMGRPMAGHLVRTGAAVTVWSRSGAAEALIAAGARTVDTLVELGESSDVVVTMLPTGAEVHEVLFGTAGIASKMRSGSLVVDTSTIAPTEARDIGRRLGDLGLRFVDAPVSGGEVGAVNGALAVMIGAEPDDVVEATEVLGAFSSVIRHVGPSGAGQYVKAANQMIVGGNLAILSEAMVLLERSPVDMDAAFEVLGSGLAASRVLQVKAAAMLASDYQPGFRIDLHRKDLAIALAAVADARLSTPVTEIVQGLFDDLRAAGDGDLDHGALLEATRRRSRTTRSVPFPAPPL